MRLSQPQRVTRLVAVIIVVGIAGFLAPTFWPRTVRLKLYTSDPYTYNGRTVRFQAVIPDDWKGWPASNAGGYVFSPTPPLGWMPGPAHRILGSKADVKQWVMINMDRQMGYYNDGAIHLVPAISVDDADQAIREVQGPISAQLDYLSWNHDDFQKYYRQICESFKVLPQ